MGQLMGVWPKLPSEGSAFPNRDLCVPNAGSIPASPTNSMKLLWLVLVMDSLAGRIVARFLEREGYGTPRGWEHRKEKDEAVLVNLPPHLQSLWRKVKYQFKGTPERRLEQFQEYVHNLGERETNHFLQEEADNQLEKMIKEYERRPPPEEEESEVPFAS